MGAIPTSRPLATLFLVSLLLLPTACKKSPEQTPTPEPQSVQAEQAQQKDLTQYITAETTLSPLAQSAIVPKISAPIKRFLVQRGAYVHQGQLLAVLENADLAASVTDSRGSLTQAQAAFDTSTKASIPEDQQKAELDVEEAKSQLDVAKSIRDARKNLLDQGAIPRRDFDTANATYIQAKAAYDIAEHHLASSKSVSRQASIQSAEGGLTSAKGRYEAAAAGLAYSEIRSPISGVVTDRPLFPGEMAQAGNPILTVMDTSALIAKVHVAQAQAQQIKLGTEALVTIPGTDAPVKAKVSLVSPALDPGSTTVEIWVKLPNPKSELKAGTPVHVQIALQTLKAVVTVPNEAIVTGKEGAPAVMVVSPDGTAKSVAVTAGINDGHDTQIISGIKPGDMVITKGAFGMDDGTKVKIAAPGADDDKDKPSPEKPEANLAPRPSERSPSAPSTDAAEESRRHPPLRNPPTLSATASAPGAAA